MLFKLLTSAVLFAALSITAPVERDETTQTAKVLFQSTSIGHVSIQVTSEDGTFLGESCSATLNSGDFTDIPITFAVDKTGFGNVTIGTIQYVTHSNITYSGGIICTMMYNDKESVTSCEVPLPSGLKPALVARGAANCIPGGKTSLGHIRSLIDKRSDLDVVPVQVEETAPLAIRNANKTLNARLACYQDFWTEKVGDGNPHQNYLQTQITESLNCGNAPSCTVGREQAFTKSVKWQVGFGAAINKWLDGMWVAMWHSTAHTAYTVKDLWHFSGPACNVVDGCDCGSGESASKVLFSPNEHNKNGSPWCMVGPQSAFHWKGYEWMDPQGPDVRPGGP